MATKMGTGARRKTIGKMRKGTAKPAKGFGRDTNYFRFKAHDNFFLSSEAKLDFDAEYPGQPQEIKIYLDGIHPATIFEDWYFQFGNNSEGTKPYLKVQCDGEAVEKYLPADGDHVLNRGDYGFNPPPCPLKAAGSCDCKIAGALYFYVRELWDKDYVYPVVLETHSKNDIVGIKTVLEQMHDFVAERGTTLHMAEFTLKREEVPITTAVHIKKGETGKGRRDVRNTWAVTITPDKEWVAKIKKNHPVVKPFEVLRLPIEGPSLLETAKPQTLTREEAVQLDDYRKKKGWSRESCVALIRHLTGAEGWLGVPHHKVPLFVDSFNSEDARLRWEQFAVQQKEEAMKA